jgi:hypothetical protein
VPDITRAIVTIPALYVRVMLGCLTVEADVLSEPASESQPQEAVVGASDLDVAPLSVHRACRARFATEGMIGVRGAGWDDPKVQI